MARIIYNNIIPFKGFQAITIWPWIFARNSAKWLKDYVVNHEGIHLRQQLEVLIVSAVVMATTILLTGISWWWMGIVPFFYYIWYCVEYLIRLCLYGNRNEACRNIATEQEAFLNEHDFNYLKEERMAFAWVKYLGRKSYRR